MSCKIVSKTTIHKVVAEFVLQERTEWLEGGHNALGEALWIINHMAYLQATSKATGAAVVATGLEDYRFDNHGFPWTPAERLKACHNLRYQCCEGDVPNRALYLSLMQVCAFAEQFVDRDGEEYKAAAWD